MCTRWNIGALIFRCTVALLNCTESDMSIVLRGWCIIKLSPIKNVVHVSVLCLASTESLPNKIVSSTASCPNSQTDVALTFFFGNNALVLANLQVNFF
jgi:hypothetical protein